VIDFDDFNFECQQCNIVLKSCNIMANILLNNYSKIHNNDIRANKKRKLQTLQK
jgi:hypothetical protein